MHNCMFVWRVNRTCLSVHCCFTITRLLSLRPTGAIKHKRTDPSCCACCCRRRSGCGAVYVFTCKCTNIHTHIDMRLHAYLQYVCEHARKSTTSAATPEHSTLIQGARQSVFPSLMSMLYVRLGAIKTMHDATNGCNISGSRNVHARLHIISAGLTEPLATNGGVYNIGDRFRTYYYM